MKNEKNFYFISFLCFAVCIIIFNFFVHISVSADYDPLYDDFANFPEFPRTATNYLIIYNHKPGYTSHGYYAYFVDDPVFLEADGTISTNSNTSVYRSKLLYDSDGLPYWTNIILIS